MAKNKAAQVANLLSAPCGRETPPRTPRKIPPKVPAPDAVYISAPQVCARYGGRSHMWLVRKLADDPKFPKPHYFGRLRFFKVHELEAYERTVAAHQPKEKVR
jgi:hypothetical protein